MKDKSLAPKILLTALVAWLPVAVFCVDRFGTAWALLGCFAGLLPGPLLHAETPYGEIAAGVGFLGFLALAGFAWCKRNPIAAIVFSVLIVISTCSFLVRMDSLEADVAAALKGISDEQKPAMESTRP